MIEIHCAHMAVTEGPHGTRHLVIFQPSAETVEVVRGWKETEVKASIICYDRSGVHSDTTEWYVSDYVYDYGTMVVTTHR